MWALSELPTAPEARETSSSSSATMTASAPAPPYSGG